MYWVAIILYLFTGSAFARIASSSANLTRLDDNDNETGYGLKSKQCELSEKPPSPDSMCCGVVDVPTNDSLTGYRYPWLALIEQEDIKLKTLNTECAGALISGLYVLTAAHCVFGTFQKTQTSRNVVLGFHDKYSGIGEVRIGIEKIIVHESYVADNVLFHDIALIMLKTMAPYTQSIRPICLPAGDLALTNEYPTRIWLTFGCGNYTAKTSSDVKWNVRLHYYLHSQCQELWSGLTANHVCAGDLNRKHTCLGSAGGPLMLQRDGQYELVGTASFYAHPYEDITAPGVYSNVFRYKEWIMQNINSETLMKKRPMY